MADLPTKQVNNITITKKEVEENYGLNSSRYFVNGEEFTEEELYELYKDIKDILPYNYGEHEND